MSIFDLSGSWRCEIPGQTGMMSIPGTLDEAGIGHPDAVLGAWHPDAKVNETLTAAKVIATRLTRKCTYTGAASISREIEYAPPKNKRIFVDVERARHLRLQVNGQEVPDYVPPTLSTPRCFEITGLLTGKDTLTFVSDNSYPTWPAADIIASSLATDETQTNWNGLLGYVRIRTELQAFIKSILVYPLGEMLRVIVDMDAPDGWSRHAVVTSSAMANPGFFTLTSGRNELMLPVAPGAALWEEGEGRIHSLTVAAEGIKEKTARFGLRIFGVKDGHFALNGRKIFLTSEACCAVYPETGYAPMDVKSWLEILSTYRAYGVTCMRFHSHTPPEAAFEAADRMGMLMQPEMNCWNPKTAFENGGEAYYEQELKSTLAYLANHPSFVMFTWGNELACGETGLSNMHRFLDIAREMDPTRLYAIGSNAFYGHNGPDRESDFFATQSSCGKKLRAVGAGMNGYLNNEYPSAKTDYKDGVQSVREESGFHGPVFTFEVGQYEVLPDFDELDDFKGVTRPDNLSLIRDKVAEKGLLPEWKKRVAATGEIALRCYREEVEAALRTGTVSGISLLGLQDFPGQGTALVGMLNSHLQPKPFAFARPERFAAFFNNVRPMVLLDKYTYNSNETLNAKIVMANWGRGSVKGCACVELTDGEQTQMCMLRPAEAMQGGVTEIGELSIPLSGFQAPAKLKLSVTFGGYDCSYPLWVYPAEAPACPENILETKALDEQALEVLAQGGRVLLAPDSTEEALPGSIKSQFSTDFWSVGTFPFQSGAMGLLIEDKHPLFKHFPTSFHADWQWWLMASQRALVLPESVHSIVTVMDSYAYLRNMGMLLECRVGAGRLMISSMGLQNMEQKPEVAALRKAIYEYMAGEEFMPTQEMDMETIRKLVAAL